MVRFPSAHLTYILTYEYILNCLFLVGGMMSLAVKSKTKDVVKCEVIDGGELKSRRHLNVRGKSATLPSITGLLASYLTISLNMSICCWFIHSLLLLHSKLL